VTTLYTIGFTKKSARDFFGSTAVPVGAFGSSASPLVR
jgi:hypothetical protein